MTTLNRSESGGRGYRALLLLLVALAALSSAMKDLNNLRELTNDLEDLTARWTNSSFFSASAAVISADEMPCADPVHQTADVREFRWSGRLAQGKAIEIKGLNGDIAADVAPSSEVEVVANKHGRRSDVNTVSIKVVEHEGGVTICAVYPTDDPNQTTPCEPGRAKREVQEKEERGSPTVGVRNNDVQVDFRIKVPAGVNFVGRTVNGEISATSLASNVVTRTVNGSIKISTSGYAEAMTVNGEISASLGNANWSGSLEFKTINGEINLDLPAATSTGVQASTFNGEIVSDFPVTMVGKFSRKEVNGTIGNSGDGGRALVLKTLNG
ncbi:MAG: DUF4097 family beta strand repeat-containing protein, partial [Pyrinomonadaceae bacterium]